MLCSSILTSLLLGLEPILFAFFGREELDLVNLHVHFFEKEAVSRHAITLSEHDDVTNDNIPVQDGNACTTSSSKHIAHIVLDFILKKQELLLLAPITERLNQASEEDGEPDGGSVDEVDNVREEAESKTGSAEEDKDLHIEFVKLVPEDGPESTNSWERADV